MKKIHLLLPVLVLLASCGTKQQTTQTTLGTTPEEQAIYDVLNFCLNSEQIAKGDKLLADETAHYSSVLNDWHYADGNNRFFTKEDMDFMRSQDNLIPFTIDAQKLSKRVKMASSKKLDQWLTESEKTGLEAYWEKVYDEYGGGYSTFTKPLFSKDYKTAVVGHGLHCGGLCGMGATYILQKGENGWQVVDVFNNWIS